MENEQELTTPKTREELIQEYAQYGLKYYTPKEENLNSKTHFFGAFLAVVGLIILLFSTNTARGIATAVISFFGAFLVYFTSGLYHSFKKIDVKAKWRRVDHANVSMVVLSCAIGMLLNLREHVYNYVALGIVGFLIVANYICCLVIGEKYFKIENIVELVIAALFVAAYFVNRSMMTVAVKALYATGGFTCLLGFIFYGRKRMYMHTVFHVLMVVGTVLCWFATYFILTNNAYFLFPADSAFWDEILDALKDSAIIFAIAFAVNIIIPFIEPKITHSMHKFDKWTPLIGVSFGLIPQCGFSVVATDLYQKKHITVGALIGIYIATSDEALPIFIANVEHPDKIIMILPLLLIKFALGLMIGYGIDIVLSANARRVQDHMKHCHHEPEIHHGCCGHEIEGEKDSKIHAHLVHPLLHSLKLFGYVLIVEIIFTIILFFVGEDTLTSFLQTNKYIAPLAAVAIGLIPNCASSVVLSELYLLGGLGFGACFGGLCVNSGIALLYLLKDTKNWKKNLAIVGTLIVVSITAGYVISMCFNFA